MFQITHCGKDQYEGKYYLCFLDGLASLMVSMSGGGKWL